MGGLQAFGRRGRLALSLVAALALSACVAQFRDHGYVPPEEDLLTILPGIDTRDTVADVLGPPTAGSVLEGGDFYYVQSRFRTLGPFEPEEVSREIVAINFDAEGIVRNIERFGLEDGRAVVLERRITDDRLRDTTFLRQLLGNFGRVNAEDLLGPG